MAYSIRYTPVAYSSAHDNLIFTVSDSDKVSDPATYPNFKFIADVYVSGTLVARLKKVADPTTGIGIFNVWPVVRNYLATTFDPVTGTLVAQEMGDIDFSIAVTMHFGEEWNFTPTYDMIVDSQRLYFNNYNGRLFGTLTNLTPYLNKVASNIPTTSKVQLSNNSYFIPYLATNTTDVPVVITPVGGGLSLSTSFTPSANVMHLLNVAPGCLNAISPGTITAQTTSYTVAIGSQSYLFKMFCEPIYSPAIVHFLNMYGGFDSFIFSKVSRETRNLEKSSFGKLPYTVDFDGQLQYYSENNVYNEQASTYASLFTQKIQLNSDLLTDGQYAWLSQLMQSPMIYLEQNGMFVPIVITDTTYEIKKIVNDELTNLTINIEYGDKLNTQFR